MRFFQAAISSSVTAAGLVCLLASCSKRPPPLTPWPDETKGVSEPLPPQIASAMFRVEGEQIVTGSGAPVQLRGIAFGNEVWEHTEIPSAHHDGRDYARVRKMGMNSVRFYLSYKTFEEDDAPGRYKQSGFDWLDQNIEWAKQNEIRLVLNMHAPVGGYQGSGGGDALWEKPELQDRFVNLWRAIARRYRAEPTVIGYGILNEPLPTKSKEQWQKLAQRTVDEIRRVDQHHIMFVERAIAVGEDWSEDENHNFVRVDDDNVVYEFHFYKPFHFTHQNAGWSDFAAREGWYPDEHVTEVGWHHLSTEAVTQSDPLPPGDTTWTMLETNPFVVTDDNLVVGKPFLVCDQGEGKAIFDSLTLTRVRTRDEESSPKRGPQSTQAEEEPEEIETVFEIDLDTRRGWYFWDPTGKGAAEFTPSGNGDSTALFISGTEGPANLGSDPLRFQPEVGYEYQLHGVAKGKDLSKKSRCGLRLEFYSSKVPVHQRTKAFLEQELDAYVKWGQEEKVPLYLGEFGVIRDGFLPGRGGVKWVSDMLSLILERDLSFAYHAYHEVPFGLFVGDRGLPSVSAVNLPLYEVFVKTLVGPDADAMLDGQGTTKTAGGEDEATPEGQPHEEQPAPDGDEGSGEGEQDVHDFD